MIRRRQADSRLWLHSSGMALPLILCFVIIIGIFLSSMVVTRVQDSRQRKTTFEYLQAHYMAQAALQHMYLKLRLLPNEAYDASSVALGFCPFDRPETDDIPTGGKKTQEPLNFFIEGLSTVGPDGENDPDEAGSWVFPSNQSQIYPLENDDPALDEEQFRSRGYRIVSASAITAFTSDTVRVLVIEIQAQGWATNYIMNAGQALQKGFRDERITKTIEIKRTTQ